MREDKMQIDFHHTATYVIARAAGFKHQEADIIAYAAQYVDDATNSGTIKFDNKAMYSRISSAHKILDYRNFDKLANHFVWLPFHFLPGNGLKKAGQNPSGSFIEKLICRPNSYIARDMLNACIKDKARPYALHRLGITMHVFADTWSHQGFAGTAHEINNVKALDEKDKQADNFSAKFKNFWGNLFDKVKNKFINNALPLGHAAALSYPDLPYLKWSYKNNKGKIIERDNCKKFLICADEMYKAFKCYIKGNSNLKSNGLPTVYKEKIKNLMLTLTDEKSGKRHKEWLKKIENGYFNFPGIKISYKEKGKGSWKYQAVGTKKYIDTIQDIFIYKPSFLKSDWKMFHDALLAHRFEITRLILPRYGICAA